LHPINTSADRKKKVFVIGLDCAEPSLIFDRWRDDFPHLKQMMEAGTFGELESVIPCITVPAWSCMMSGKDPGQLGVYGFHNRGDHSYDNYTVSFSTEIKEPLIWDLISPGGKQSVLIGVPPSYPPRPLNGISVGCFLTPSIEREFTYPASVAQELHALVGEYLVDVPKFRTEDKDHLIRQIYAMTEKRFTVIKHFLKTKPWDFFMFVEIGVDRVHHGMWKYHDPAHPKHEPGNRYQNTIHDYYRYLDSKIGELLGMLDDDTVVLVVSDHGAQKMDGGICINEWLMQEGYLVIKERPSGVAPLDKCVIDWSRTMAWGSGGYYGRVFLNVRGREPEGLIRPPEYEAVRDEIAGKITALTGPDGREIGTRVFKPENIYRECKGVPPDLMVYFGNLRWRAVGSIGMNNIYTFENDTGPDDANHSQFGMFIFYDPRHPGKGRMDGVRIIDIAPTLLQEFGLPIPSDMIGNVLNLRKGQAAC
jgi:predicted AlkP superfamily phosphohydrolase/phosphomutase